VIYLLLQSIFASAFTLVIKWAQLRERDDIVTVGSINYIIAFVLILPIFLMNDVSEVSPGAVWTGASMGGIYFIAYFFAIYCIRTAGASSATVVGVLSILIPIAVAAQVWSEIPSGLQVFGISLALVALLLIGLKGNNDSTKNRTWQVPLIMLGFFLLCGLSRVSQDTFKHISSPDQRSTFVVAAFGVAAIPSLAFLIYRRKRVALSEFSFGFTMGLANVLQTQMILKCLEHFPGYIVFPVTSAGAIVITTLVATSLMKEKLSRQTLAGIAIAVVALFLLY
jgi:drug/metabolite transporter (DMT)-like permease